MKSTYAITVASAIAVTGALCFPALAWDQHPFDEYIQRSDTVTLGAGDAKDENAVTHIINPWPRYSARTWIPGHGQRMSDAIERYRDVSKLPSAPRPIEPVFDVQSAGGAGGSGK